MNNEYEHVAVAETEEERVIDLREIFHVLLSKAIWIVLCVAIFVAGAAIYTKTFTKPQYRATAVVYVNDGNMSATNNIAVATYLAEDYAKTVTLPSVLEKAINNLALDMSYQELTPKVSISLEEESRIVEITVTDTAANIAQALCNEICLVSKYRFEELVDATRVSLYEEARLPSGPSGPNMMRNMMLAGVIGFVLPCAVILLIYMIDDRIKSAEDIQRVLKLSTLGDIPYRRDN
ncbi:MAG: hypothetical protein IJY20_08075 [Clostridia bacterium]|nr:hypothetical protein [Clostridia bacterium]